VGRLAAPAGQRVQRFLQNIGTINYASGGSPFINVPQADYTTAFDIVSYQTVTSGSTIPVVAAQGAFGPLSLVSVKVNGARHPFSMPGYAADVYSRVRSAPYASQMTSDPLTASTATNWTNHLHIPLTLADDTVNGAWYTGDTTLQMTVGINCATAAQVFSTVNGATIQGSWNVYRESFNAPPPMMNATWLQAISWYHEVIQQGTFQLKNGTTPIDLPRDQDYQRIFLNLYTGNDFDSTYAPADGLLVTVDLGINNKIHIFDTNQEAEALFQQVLVYAEILPNGWYVLDFERIKDSVRDILPTDTSSVQMLRLNIVSTSSSNNCDVFTETVVDSPFAQKWIAMYQAQSGNAQSAANAGAPAPAAAGSAL
jgi:hypothetical protein